MISKKQISKSNHKLRGTTLNEADISYNNFQNLKKHKTFLENTSPFRELNIHNNYKKFNHLDSTNYRSCHSAISNKPLELTNKFQFNQMRDEISLIQGKIQEIEKKYAVAHSNGIKKTQSHVNDQSRFIFNENQHYNTLETENIPNKTKELFEKSPLILNHKYTNNSLKSPNYHDNTRQTSFIDYRQTTTEGSVDPFLKKEYLFLINDWKDKFLQLSQDYEVLKKNFINEKQKNEELERLKTSNEEKNREISVLKCKLQGTFEEKDQLMYKYHQSESIRIEQSRLIQSLNAEIEKLNLSINTNTNKNVDKPKGNIEIDYKDEVKTKPSKDLKKKKPLSSKKSKSVTKDKKVTKRLNK